jgi:hypothetical protein
VLSKFRRIEAVPPDAADWGLAVRGAAGLAATLVEQRELALLFKDLATLRTSVRVRATEERLRWRGPRRTFRRWAAYLRAPELLDEARRVASGRG